MGEDRAGRFRFSFNRSVSFEGRGDRLTADAGAVMLRELDARLGVTDWLTSRLRDDRDGSRVTHTFAELLRQRLFLIALGHRDQDDVDRLRHDPALRLAVAERRGLSPLQTHGLASQPTHSRFVQTLAQEHNLAALNDGLFESARRNLVAEGGFPQPAVTIDVDSMPIEVHGHQPGSEWNGHFGMRCYHPIVAMLGDTHHWLAARLRPGNAHTAHGVLDFLLPVVARARRAFGKVVRIRADAGFPEPKLLRILEKRRIGYVFRLRNNATLDRLAEPYLRRPVGRRPKEPREWLYDLSYRAGSWERPRRVVLVVQERPDELFLYHFFLLTSASQKEMSAETALAEYRERGTMEAHVGEIQSVLAPALSCTDRGPPDGPTAERRNAATFLLYALAYNLAHAARRVLAREHFAAQGAALHLGRLRDLLLRVAALLVTSARRATFVLNRATAVIWTSFCRGLHLLHPFRA